MRFTLTADRDQLVEYYELINDSFPDNYKKTYNAAPHQSVLSIINDGTCNRAGYIQWGVPTTDKGTSKGVTAPTVLNEQLSPYRELYENLKSRRLVIPVDSFYVWKKTQRGEQPLRILMKSEDIFSLAAIYNTWKSDEGRKLSHAAIIMTDSNRLVRPFDQRMPAILAEDDVALWLSREQEDHKILRSLLKPFNPDLMKQYPVSMLLNDISYNSPILIKKNMIDNNYL
ncbi:SOS response-associated peptidase [Paenibacillus sp. FSL P4-0288]|uniref:SOS response-associated peptidase n=1 Tax=Paenibacillus sp. FSL P4-0288 TaxID=2921633 RepID=UPI0030F96935